MVYYFAYGSNMDEGQMRERLTEVTGRCGHLPVGSYKIIGGGKITGHLLVFNKIKYKSEGVGYANIIDSKDSNVEGLIYEIDTHARDRLDCYERYPDHYGREEILIKSNFNRNFKCWVYIANPNMISDGLKPTKEYMKHIFKGKEFLSEEYRAFLENVETAD